MIILKKWNELSIDELYDILALREDIFIVEQNCPYNDLDYKDQKSLHLFYREEGKIISYLRLLPSGISYDKSPSIGRVITKTSARGRGLSRKLMQYGIDFIFSNMNEITIEISGQKYLRKFYESLGFRVEGQEYLEDNILHYHMVLNKK